MEHDGHRSRLREKAAKNVTEPHEKLELFLFGVLPRVNTNGIAHALLDRFGGIRGMLSMNIERLMSVNGIGRAAAIHIRNMAGIIREYELAQCHTGELLTSEFELYKYLCALFACEDREKTYMLMFSAKKRYIGYQLIGEGTFTQNNVLLKPAILCARDNKAASVIIAHNHPDMIAIPSMNDIESAQKMNVKFGNMGINIIEHYVVADGRCIPFMDRTKE